MALFPVSYTLPQVLAVAVAGQLLFYLNLLGPELGYRVVFGTAAIWFFFATVASRTLTRFRSPVRAPRALPLWRSLIHVDCADRDYWFCTAARGHGQPSERSRCLPS